ncbi:MAG: DUF2652 domain-containing protein [Bacteroidota bacterium]|nr:DUF2652 domain-containing protein [Bacteroidota bacterium]
MQGLIFIPDISGFTNFVKNIDIDLGVSITKDLLNVILDNNSLDLDISEIEGDAVLFYKIGQPISLEKVFNCFRRMYEAFNTNYQHCKLLYNLRTNLSLKLVVHYGNIIVYDVKGFKKLYGETIIESHQLLKNGNGASEYILITKDYVKALQQNISKVLVNDFKYNTCSSQLYTGIKKIAYYFFSALKKSSQIPEQNLGRKSVSNDEYRTIVTKRNALIPGYCTIS